MKNKFLASIILVTCFLTGKSQQNVDLTNLDAFIVDKNWKIAGEVSADLVEREKMTSKRGDGVLVNLPTSKLKSNLLTKAEYGDMDLELEFMMASHSNSGIYMQGRYEVQLLDSWGKVNPTYGDCGGIYQRRRKDGSQFEGHAPLINACKAPGTWQKMSISFQAPKFNSSGVKIQNAKILEVILNGYTIQKNIELTGPTGGPISEEEASKGPIMIQGDHGPVAFRNISITSFDESRVTVDKLTAKLYKGEIKPLQNFEFDGMDATTPDVSTIDVSKFTEEVGWAVVYSGTLNVENEGDYSFSLQAGGESMMKVGSTIVVSKGWSRPNWPSRSSKSISLTKGDHPFEIYYAKVDGWLPTGLGVFAESATLRSQPLHSGIDVSLLASGQGSVFLSAEKPKVTRSFMSYPVGDELEVLTHVVNVGNPNGLHYSFNTQNGSLLKIWRGNYLDVSPMWNGRGNAQAISMGSELILSNVNPIVKVDKRGVTTAYKSLGYDINTNGNPTFRYIRFDEEIKDEILSVDGKSINRTITGGQLTGLVLGTGARVEKMSDSLYSVNDKEYLIEFSGPAEILGNEGTMMLISTSESSTVTYSIIW